jgi:1-acyl-sn-glycerol-3-phosphate acyltransferase
MYPRRYGNPFWRLYEVLAMCFGLGLLALLCLLSIPLFLLLYITLPRRWHRPVSRHVVRLSFRFYLTALRWLCQVHIDLDELTALQQDGPLIVVANHPSLLDAVILLGSLPNASCILKASLLHNPLYGMGARMAGYVSNENPRRMIEASCSELRQGAHFVLFPEGGRTREFPLSPFSSACILLSKQSQVPLQAVIFHFSTPYLGKHWGLITPPRLPLTIRVRLGRRFAPPQITAQALEELESYFREELRSDGD